MATAGEVGGHQRCRWCFCGWLFGRLGQGKGHGGAFSGKLVGYRRVKGSCGLLVGVSWSFFGDFGSFFFGDMTYDLHLMLQTGGLETISLVDTSSVRSQWDLAFQSVILLHFTYISIAFIQDKISSWESTYPYISLIQGTFVSMIFSFPQMGYVSPLQGIHPFYLPTSLEIPQWMLRLAARREHTQLPWWSNIQDCTVFEQFVQCKQVPFPCNQQNELKIFYLLVKERL